MIKKRILTLSKNFYNIESKQQLLYFGRLSEFFFKENFSNSEDKISSHNFCNSTYENILPDLVKSLNKLHKVQFSLRSWNIILGPWLRVFIHVSYENFYTLNKVIKENSVEQIYAIKPDEYDLFTNNGWDLESANIDENWNCALNSKILHYLDTDKKIEYKKINDSNFTLKQERKKPRKNIVIYLLSFIGKFFNFFKKENDACIFSSGLPYLYEKKLELLMGQIPQFYNFDEKIIFKKFDRELRKKILLNLEDTSNKFEKFLRDTLPFSLPIHVIESFEDINEQSENSEYPKNPRLIFTSDAFSYHEIFKFYLAKKTQEGAPYYLGQHGNSYFTHVHTNHTPEMKGCDRFISWGAKGNNKSIKSFNFKVLNKRKKFNNKGKLLAVFDGLNISGMPIFDLVAREKKSLESALKIILNLNKDIQSQTVGRLYWLNNYALHKSYKNKIKNLNITIDEGTKPIKSLLKDTRLTFFNFDSTGILENLALNIPTFCYWENTFGFINPKFVDVYKLLIKAKILFEDSDDLVKHIEKNWLDVNRWWMNTNTQNYIKEFNSKINITPHAHSLEHLKKALNREVKI